MSTKEQGRSHLSIKDTHEVCQNQLIYSIVAPELLSWEDVQLLAELSGCPTATKQNTCEQSRHSRYRTISGVCNNR